MRLSIGIAALVLLGGCATSERNIYGGAFGQNVVGNEVGVTVTNVWNEVDAFPLAEQHCRQFDRAARLNRFAGYRATYDCVKP